MSAETRQAIADAASSVDGINCTPYFRQTTKAGEAMVRLDRLSDLHRFGGLATWQVVVILTQDLASAERFVDTKANDLIEALSDEMTVTSITPQQIQLDSTVLPALFIEGTREVADFA